ncbi:reverse transcriptase family protein [Lichenihabitans sp. Uapishka_5]|uniref:reverse transcriptase family protein n=1 Tax=Lichenihabitans sp. Uapishka_5 TaxID=3037302 RepID=UPI0029E80E51|nr:reverse transcriptase family protein [Lichenihabitans sp. Uapishka_5]MDX7953437.1 reverse transcriptase family protein [Lichenihabitans sp. Uapishka_5]
MPFQHDLRRVTTRDALIAALNIDLDIFEAVLAFEPPPAVEPGAAESSGSAAELTIPMFFRHDIPKKNRARGLRTVWEPTRAKPHYKALARWLESFFRLTVPGYPHGCAFGYRLGRNIRENAMAHAGHRSLLSLDIKDFFPTIATERITGLFQSLGVTAPVSDLLGRFMTIGGSLPLGLPTSPVLSNAIALPIDVECQALARDTGSTYTRYADDLSFSGDADLPDIDKVRLILRANGFALAEDKTHRSQLGQAHFVTGLSITDPAQPHVPRSKKRRLRQELYYTRKFGIADHLRHGGVNDDGLIKHEVNRIDGMVRFVAYHEPRMAARLRTKWKAILRKNGMKPSFVPHGQHRAPFHIFVDEAEFDKAGSRVLALGMAVSQHGPRIMAEGGELLEAVLADMWAPGDATALRRRGLHYADATEDLRSDYIKLLAALPFEGYVAFADCERPGEYEDTYLRLLGAMIRRRLMAAESQYALIVCERNSKVSEERVRACIGRAFDELKVRDDRRPRNVFVEFVSKPHLGVSAPDFLLGVLGKYLRSNPAPDGRPEGRDRLMFERLRDKYRLILDLSTWTEYSRRRPILPWAGA